MMPKEPKDQTPAFTYEAVYTGEGKIELEGKYYLPTVLSGKTYDLPLVNVTPENETTLAIAWFDPDPATNPELCQSAAEAMTALLKKQKAEVVVMPASSKSEAFITQAVQTLPGIKLVKLSGGKNKEEVEFTSDPNSVIGYTAVTGKKFMGLPVGQSPILRQASQVGLRVVLVDDVRSTGGTIEAMKQTLAAIFGKDSSLPVAVIAQEALLGKNYPPLLSQGMSAVMALPEIPGLEAKKLFPVTKRKNIPAARVNIKQKI